MVPLAVAKMSTLVATTTELCGGRWYTIRAADSHALPTTGFGPGPHLAGHERGPVVPPQNAYRERAAGGRGREACRRAAEQGEPAAEAAERAAALSERPFAVWKGEVAREAADAADVADVADAARADVSELTNLSRCCAACAAPALGECITVHRRDNVCDKLGHVAFAK